MQDILKILNEKPKKQLTDSQQFYAEAKTKIQSIVDGFKQIEKHCKATKLSRAFMRAAHDFLKCNITSSAIEKKYSAVVAFLDKVYQARNQNELQG